MSGSIVAKDVVLFRREPFVRGLMLVIALLVAGSVFTGLQREQDFNDEKAAALAADESVWMNQGERNPHSAAHFSRYAFRPALPLALLDPGTTDYAGLAIWMEAHNQDPAVFRRAEDAGELGRYAQLTPAFLVLTVAPLVIFLMLFGSVAGEREDGTLRQLLATGVSTRQFFLGKLSAGLKLTILAYTAVIVPVGILAVVFAPAESLADALIRFGALYVTYAAYLAVFVFLGIGISALFRTRQSAFLALTCVWALMTIILPRLASDIGTNLYPQPDAREVLEQLEFASDAYEADPDGLAGIQREALETYEVSSVEALPINFDAFLLQAREELSVPEFDRVYASLDARYANQESVIRSFVPLTPFMSTTNLSRGFAGTDRAHQNAFAQAAENHRRTIIRQLNEDYMLNSGAAGHGYTADAELWAEIEQFDYTVPGLLRIGSGYSLDVFLLITWLIGSALIAYRLVGRAVRREVPGI